MSAQIFVEGGGNTAQLKSRCREAFTKLLRRCGYRRMPRIHAAGSRRDAFDRFTTAHDNVGENDYVAMLIDSESQVTNAERPWDHLANRPGDRWSKPPGATDDQVLLMTTSMETWIAADRELLHRRFPRNFNANPLPDVSALEEKSPAEVLNALKRATNRRYEKKAISFEFLGNVDPEVLGTLRSFRRTRRVLDSKLSY